MRETTRPIRKAGDIAVMPPDLANQIAAGEVVERPASVVKELLENSVDAGAEEIAIDIEGGGRRLISVRDDGSGMGRDEARLALERHATSKLRIADDLFNIRTLGFRGEALPSIASVSRFTLTTRRSTDLEGTRVQVDGGEIASIEPAACPAGTEVAVRDLFYNTPARLKFLKSETTERRHITESVVRLGLGRFKLRLRLRADGRVTVEAPANNDLRERVASLLGERVAESLYPIVGDHARGEVRVTGLFGRPDVVRRNTGGIYTYVNGRFVRDRRMQAAITVAYGSLVDRGRYPNVVLHVTLPPDTVDVNVHPMKTEVRFGEPDLVFRAIRAALIDGLASTPWVPKTGRPARVYRLDGAVFGDDDEGTSPQALVANSSLPVQQTIGGTGRLSTADMSRGGWWTTGGELSGLTDELPPDRYFSSLIYRGRLGDTYLLCQDEDGLVVIDQHAAHERVTFERLRGVYAGHHRESQSLLLPLQLDLTRARAEVAREHHEFLASVGFELEPLSGDSFVLRSIPAVLRGARYERLIEDALDELALTGHTQRLDEAVDAVLSRMACHGSVRAGDRLKRAEAEALLAQMDEIDFKANCPHGRPVFFRLSWMDIEKRFERR